MAIPSMDFLALGWDFQKCHDDLEGEVPLKDNGMHAPILEKHTIFSNCIHLLKINNKIRDLKIYPVLFMRFKE